MCAAVYTALFEDLSADCTRENEGSGESAGEVSAAAGIVGAVVALEAGIIRVTGTGCHGDISVVLRAGVGVAYHGGKGSAGSSAVIEAR